jgi:preprotein translocase subunit SecB
MQSLLNITDFFVDELKVRINHEYKKSGKEIADVTTSIGIKRKAKEPEFMINMTVELNKSKEAFAKAPYYIYLDIVGFFSFIEGTDEETMSKMIGLNCPAIIYGVARGIVAQATANFRHGKFVLPTVNFVEAMKKAQSKKGKKR